MPLEQSNRYKLHQPVVETDEFIVGFPVFGVEDLTVYVDGVLNELYSVVATFTNGRSDDAVIKLVTAVSGVDVEIYGTRIPRRDDNYLGNSPSLAQRLQEDADRLTAVQQEQARDYGSTIRVSPNSPVVTPLSGGADDRADRVIAFDETGYALTLGPSIDEIASAQGYSESAASSASAAATSASAAETAADRADNEKFRFYRRLALKNWWGQNPPPLGGVVLSDSEVEYVVIPVGHVLYGTDPIPDIPGLMPFGVGTPRHFGAVGDGVTDDTEAVVAAITTGLPLDWGAKTYTITETIDILTPVAVDWKSDGAKILYDGPQVGYVVRVTVPKNERANIIGDFTIDCDSKAPGALDVRSGRESGDGLNKEHTVYMKKLHARNIYRADKSTGVDSAITVRGGFYMFHHEGCSVINAVAAEGSEEFASMGIFGITTTVHNTHRISHIVSEGFHAERIYSERKGYIWDQDGERYFQDVGVGNPNQITCQIIGGVSKNIGNRSVKAHSTENLVVTGRQIIKDNAVMDIQSVRMLVPANVTLVGGETLTQDVTGASGVVIDGNRGAGDSLVTNVSEIHLASTSTNWNTTNDLSGSATGSLGLAPMKIVYNETGSPDIDMQQSPGTISGVTFTYLGVTPPHAILQSYDSDHPWGSMVVSDIRGFVDHPGNNMAVAGISFSTPNNPDLHIPISNISVKGEIGKVMRNRIGDDVSTTFMLSNISAEMLTSCVEFWGVKSDQDNVKVMAVNCRNLAADVPFIDNTIDHRTVIEFTHYSCFGFDDTPETVAGVKLQFTGNVAVKAGERLTQQFSNATGVVLEEVTAGDVVTIVNPTGNWLDSGSWDVTGTESGTLPETIGALLGEYHQHKSGVLDCWRVVEHDFSVNGSILYDYPMSFAADPCGGGSLAEFASAAMSEWYDGHVSVYARTLTEWNVRVPIAQTNTYKIQLRAIGRWR